MASDSKIQWTHHTFNPWRGCTKVSAGCKNCYAEALSKRNPKVLGVWGPNGTREIGSESYWREPLAWAKAAAASGERHRVFCASLADVFEGQDTMPAGAVSAVRAARVRLFDLIRRTPELDWLLLTKRPENVWSVLAQSIILAEGGDPDDEEYFQKHGDDFCESDLGAWLNDWTGELPPKNVWLGISAEDQDTYNARVGHLLRANAMVRFLSLEPLLGSIDMTAVQRTDGSWMRPLDGRFRTVDWVIVGGESGPNARPCNVQWIMSVVDQCKTSEVPVFVKQVGAKAFVDVYDPDPATINIFDTPKPTHRAHFAGKDPKGGDPSEWPKGLRVREMPGVRA